MLMERAAAPKAQECYSRSSKKEASTRGQQHAGKGSSRPWRLRRGFAASRKTVCALGYRCERDLSRQPVSRSTCHTCPKQYSVLSRWNERGEGPMLHLHGGWQLGTGITAIRIKIIAQLGRSVS